MPLTPGRPLHTLWRLAVAVERVAPGIADTELHDALAEARTVLALFYVEVPRLIDENRKMRV